MPRNASPRRWPNARGASGSTVDGTLFIVAADHTARGMIGVPGQPRAMVDRRTMLERLLVALDNPRVDGVLGSADILEDLVCLGALDGKVAVGTMNRGGLAGATWEIDDRFTAYDADHLVAANLDAGKMLLRIDPDDRGTVPTLAACAAAVGAAQRPADDGDGRADPVHARMPSGRAVWDHDPEALLKAVGVCAALGGSSAYTWLKIQATADIATVAAVTTQPLLILGGSPGPDPDATFALVGAGPGAADRARPRRRSGPALSRRTVTSRRPSAGPPSSVVQGGGRSGRSDDERHDARRGTRGTSAPSPR